MMRVLDIDLDFFLNDCCPLAPVGERPSLEGHEPWDETDVIDFLENNCAVKKPVFGRIFETHDKALCFWLELIEKEKLSFPFHVTHVDAHSDLGIGKPGPGYVLNTVLAMNIEERRKIRKYYEQKQLDEANYLLFAIGMRLISSLDNVRNPKSRPDIPTFASEETGKIQLTSFSAKLFEEKNGTEPVVAFNVYNNYKDFVATESYDFISVAISPRYSPAEADSLLSIFSNYIVGI